MEKMAPFVFQETTASLCLAQIGERPDGRGSRAREPKVNLVRFDSILCARAPTAAAPPAGTSDGRAKGENGPMAEGESDLGNRPVSTLGDQLSMRIMAPESGRTAHLSPMNRSRSSSSFDGDEWVKVEGRGGARSRSAVCVVPILS